MAPLEDLLDRAAMALLAGDLIGLSRLSPLIEDALGAVSPDPVLAVRLQAKAHRNARLLEAATRGVKAARNRMAEIANGPVLTTYDARGQKAAIAAFAGDPARRV